MQHAKQVFVTMTAGWGSDTRIKLVETRDCLWIWHVLECSITDFCKIMLFSHSLSIWWTTHYLSDLIFVLLICINCKIQHSIMNLKYITINEAFRDGLGLKFGWGIPMLPGQLNLLPALRPLINLGFKPEYLTARGETFLSSPWPVLFLRPL